MSNKIQLPQPANDDGLELMPQWLVGAIPHGEAQKDERGRTIIWAKLFTPDADWYLFVSDYDPIDRVVFCYAILNGDVQNAEWGWQDLDVLLGVRGKLGLPMERDIFFTPKPLEEALEDFKRSRGLVDAERQYEVHPFYGSSEVLPNGNAVPDQTPPADKPIEITPPDYTKRALPAPEDPATATNGEYIMRSVQTDDVQAALLAHIHDGDRNRPVMIDFVGSRNAVKQLLTKPFNPENIGSGETCGFYIVNASYLSSFRLPDNAYKSMAANLRNRTVEGRIVSLDATTSAPRKECYVLVSEQIRIPQEDTVLTHETWQRCCRYMETPNHPEFAKYTPPTWAANLYNIYQALRVRIGRPLHISWMPWLFQEVTDMQISSEKLNIKDTVLCKYIPGYVDPKATGAVEAGAYRLICMESTDLWGEIIMRNPTRTEGIF